MKHIADLLQKNLLVIWRNKLSKKYGKQFDHIRLAQLDRTDLEQFSKIVTMGQTDIIKKAEGSEK